MRGNGEARRYEELQGNGKVSRGVETVDELARNDTNCRETDERCRALKRKGKAMFGEGIETIGLDLQRDGIE